MINKFQINRSWLASWAQVQRRKRKNHLPPPVPPPLVPLAGFPDLGVSANGYNMDGNELLLHFNHDLLDSSGHGRNVTPFTGGQWSGPPGVADDISFGSFSSLGTVCFNWAGGSSETFLDGDSTVIFWVKLSYSATEATDGFNQPLICFNHNNNQTGLLLMGGIMFLSSPPREADTVTLNLTHGTMFSICEWSLNKYEWVQLAIVSSGANHKVYVNGILTAEGTTNAFNSQDHLRFGGWYNDNQMSISPAVEMAEFAVFSRAMAADEIANIYTQQNL